VRVHLYTTRENINAYQRGLPIEAICDKEVRKYADEYSNFDIHIDVDAEEIQSITVKERYYTLSGACPYKVFSVRKPREAEDC